MEVCLIWRNQSLVFRNLYNILFEKRIYMWKYSAFLFFTFFQLQNKWCDSSHQQSYHKSYSSCYIFYEHGLWTDRVCKFKCDSVGLLNTVVPSFMIRECSILQRYRRSRNLSLFPFWLKQVMVNVVPLISFCVSSCKFDSSGFMPHVIFFQVILLTVWLQRYIITKHYFVVAV